MTLFRIGILILISLLAGLFNPKNKRIWFFSIASILAMFWVQPLSPIRNLDFWLPLSALLLVVFSWFATQPSPGGRQTGNTLFITAGLLLFICLLRYTEPVCCLTASRPPSILQVIIPVGILIILFFGLYFILPNRRYLSGLLIALIIIIFIVLKTDFLSTSLSKIIRSVTGQDPNLASAIDLEWIGFSYLAFRLLHYLRDRQTGKIPEHHLNDLIAYALFFPAFTAGPIDRFPHFLQEINKPDETKPNRFYLSLDDFYQGSGRIIWGIFKKFVLADTLALIALNSQNALQIKSSFWAWVVLYAYAFRIYFDFSGYTDIAIGIAKYMGVQLPENFKTPYTKTNLTQFWNSWHITLAQWLRAYIFNPLTRAMRSSRLNFQPWAIILTAQCCTMLLIGLWHGVTLNFAIWGLWHAVGLFIHNRWSDWRKTHNFKWENKHGIHNLLSWSSWFITINYVTLGWVWFALPGFRLASPFFKALFGLS